jgi:hypothetical protein
MLVLEEKASLARRAEAISAVRSSRVGMAKTRGGVAIDPCGHDLMSDLKRFDAESL